MKFCDHETSYRRYRGPVLAALLAAIYFQGLLGWELQPVRTAFRTVTAPVQYPFEALASAMQTVRTHVSTVESLREALHASEVRAAKAELAARLGEEARLEAARLEKALSARSDIIRDLPVEPIFARVVGRSTVSFHWRITLDVGSVDGVTVDSPVIYGADLLGRVIQVLPYRSRVLLVQDPASALGILVEGHRSPGVARGTGATHLELSDFPAGAPLAKGQRVLTGALSAYYPRGLIVGILHRDEEDRMRVAPRHDPFRLEEAFVLPLRPRTRSAGNISEADP